MMRESTRRNNESSIYFCHDTATTEIYTLSLHDALPIYSYSLSTLVFARRPCGLHGRDGRRIGAAARCSQSDCPDRKSTRLNSQSRQYLVCRLLLEKKNLTLPPTLTRFLTRHGRILSILT